MLRILMYHNICIFDRPKNLKNQGKSCQNQEFVGLTLNLKRLLG